jgi:M6 family metalloprotease-like protein
MSRTRIVRTLLLIVAASAAPSIRMAADVTPQTGDQFPRGYYLRRQRDPRAFTFRRALIQQAERIRTARLAVMSRAAGMAPGASAREVVANDADIAVRGTRTIPVLPVLFKNTTAKPFNEPDLDARLFGATGNTMTSFYRDNSYGKLDVRGKVHPWHQLANNDTFYEGADFMDRGRTATCNGMCDGAKLPDMLRSALAAVDSTIDFGQFDNDGPDGRPNSGDDDGFADFVAFVQPERGGECGAPGGGVNRNIWSHRWTLSSWTGAQEFETNDAAAGSGGKIKVDDYVIMPAVNCDGQTMIHIGVFAHEFGHAFGLPDLYDTDPNNGASQGDGIWCLMASGSWGGDNKSPELPTHMSAWAKVFLGWLQPQLITTSQSVNLSPVQSGRTAALKIPISTNQYYLLEYRAAAGFDAKLPSPGLLIWRINDTVVNVGLRTNRVNADAANKGVDLVEADGRNHLDLPGPPSGGGNRGDAGDPYPGSSQNRRLDAASNPKAQGNLSVCAIGNPAATVAVQVNVGQNACTP